MAKQSAAKQSDAAFQIGDRVKVIDGGALGTVHEINVHLTSGAVQYWVRFADGTDETFVCYDALSLQAID